MVEPVVAPGLWKCGDRQKPGHNFAEHLVVAEGGRNLIEYPWRPRNLKDTAKQFVFLLLTGKYFKRWW
jgi:hypothetical protein